MTALAIPRLLRAAAIVIAIAGAIDPAYTRATSERPEVSVIADNRLPDPALVDRVTRALETRFTVMKGEPFGSSAIVSVGYRLPTIAVDTKQPAFAVVPEPTRAFVAITSVKYSPQAHLQSRVPILVSVHAVAAAKKTVTVSLIASGVAGDRVTRTVAGDDVIEKVELSHLPTAAGDAQLVVTAAVDDGDMDSAPVAINARDTRAAVLFFDRRPSWMSTFVRRAAESDPRLVVTSRVETSRGIASTEGRAPEGLSLPSLELFDTVVAGAPETLSESDVAGLQSFLRDGGSVVLLLDEPDALSKPHPVDRLIGSVHFARTAAAEPKGLPLASDRLSPAPLPDWADPYRPASDRTMSADAVWQTHVGRGRLIVSGALDAWRYRDRDDAAFDTFWRSMLSEPAAKSALPPAGTRADRDTTDDRALLTAWTSSRKGAVIKESELNSLTGALTRALSPPDERRVVHPMRSAWWIVPFGLLLGVEWWTRRRTGKR